MALVAVSCSDRPEQNASYPFVQLLIAEYALCKLNPMHTEKNSKKLRASELGENVQRIVLTIGFSFAESIFEFFSEVAGEKMRQNRKVSSAAAEQTSEPSGL